MRLVDTMAEAYPEFCLTSPTYKALMQTVKATVELCYYLLENENEINYVLLGYLQQDWLEGRFGAIFGIDNSPAETIINPCYVFSKPKNQ